jgi:hypothetical protein
MQPIVFLKAIVPFTSSIIDLLADTSSASSLSNGRHPPSSAPFHPSFFSLSGVSVPPLSLMGFSPLLSCGFQCPVGFQSPFVSHGVSVPLLLSWGFSPPSSPWGFSPPLFPWVSFPCGVSVPLRLSWVSFPCGVSVPLRLPWVSFPHGVSVPPSSHLFSVSVGHCPSVSVHPPFTLDTSAWCIAAYNRASPPHPLDMHHICPHRSSHTPACFPSDSPRLTLPPPPPPLSTMGHALPATTIRVPPPPFHLPCLSTGIYQHCTVLPTVCAEGEFLIS